MVFDVYSVLTFVVIVCMCERVFFFFGHFFHEEVCSPFVVAAKKFAVNVCLTFELNGEIL